MPKEKSGVVVRRRYAGEDSGRPQKRAVRRDGWTIERRQQFLDMLADSCNVTAAAKAAGMTAHSARELKKREADFGRAWDEAIAEGYEKLELVMLERAIHGTEGPRARSGGDDSRLRRYNDAVGLRLLQAHRETARRNRAREEDDADEVFAEIKRRFAEIRARQSGAGGE